VESYCLLVTGASGRDGLQSGRLESIKSILDIHSHEVSNGGKYLNHSIISSSNNMVANEYEQPEILTTYFKST